MRGTIDAIRRWVELPSHRWIVGGLTLSVIVLTHLLTLRISPTVWQDEVQIVDLGRGTLWPSEKAWSLSWTPAQRPVTFVNYLGVTIQELAYRLAAPSSVGPRVSTLAGAVLSAVLAYAWLRRRRTPRPLAWSLGVLLLLDPLFVASYRGARVDSWVLACMFAACLLVRRGAEPDRSIARHMSGAAVLAVIAFFVWPSAFYLYPLLVAEFIEVAPTRTAAALARWLRPAAIAGSLALLLCVAPLWSQRGAVWADLFVSKNAYLPGTFVGRILENLLALPATFGISPIFPILAVVAAILRYRSYLVAAAVVALLSMLPTQIYGHRVLFLLPYFVGLVGDGYQEMSVRWSGPAGARLRQTCLGLAMAWAVALSLIGRSANAWSQREERDPERLITAAEVTLGHAQRRVYLGPWELYYAGRFLGWEMFREYGTFSSAEWRTLLGHVDSAILGPQVPAEFAAHLAAAGLERSAELRVGQQPTKRARLGASPYGTYLVYSRRPTR